MKTNWNKRINNGLIIVFGILVSVPLLSQTNPHPKAIRATEITAHLWSELEKGYRDEIIVEFRQNDRLPVSFHTEGDLLETTESSAQFVTVKRNFWVKFDKKNIHLSLDGVKFTDFENILAGSLTAGVSAENPDGIASAISMIFKATLK